MPIYAREHMNVATGKWSGAIKLDAPMQDGATLCLLIQYPLTRPYTHIVTHPDGSGWTKRQFGAEVTSAYEHVYGVEADTAAHPGEAPGTWNRAKSEGAYGIWGHELAGLALEGAERRPDGVWQVWVGS